MAENDTKELAAFARAGTTPCAEAHVWVCGACGKTSRTRYGFNAADQSVASPGWDESCMLNAVLCHREQRLRDSDGLKEWVAVCSPEEAKPASDGSADGGDRG